MLSKPNPFNYNTNKSTFSQTGAKIGNERRKGMENVTYAPGPGAYNPTPVKMDKNYSIPKSQSVSKLTSSKNSPGPGSYEPRAMLNSQYESIKVSKDKRRAFYDEKQGIPGPGSYNYGETTIPKNGFSIPHEKRG